MPEARASHRLQCLECAPAINLRECRKASRNAGCSLSSASLRTRRMRGVRRCAPARRHTRRAMTRAHRRAPAQRAKRCSARTICADRDGVIAHRDSARTTRDALRRGRSRQRASPAQSSAHPSRRAHDSAASAGRNASACHTPRMTRHRARRHGVGRRSHRMPRPARCRRQSVPERPAAVGRPSCDPPSPDTTTPAQGGRCRAGWNARLSGRRRASRRRRRDRAARRTATDRPPPARTASLRRRRRR